jgi:CheY-like chemotaxis protein
MATDTVSASSAGPARPGRLLVVDDDENVTNMLRRALSFEGYAVATARDGADALKKTLEFAPDLVVLDIMMPGIDGVEVARRLRAGDPQLAILMLTAKDAAADQVVGLDAGAATTWSSRHARGVHRAHSRPLAARASEAESRDCDLTRHRHAVCAGSARDR